MNKYKVALLGTGKTGGEFSKFYKIPKRSQFNSAHHPTLEELKEHDVIVSFLPGKAFLFFLPLILQSGRPLICGTTGFEWPKKLNPQKIDRLLKHRKIKWIMGANFALGMNVFYELMRCLSRLTKSNVHTKTAMLEIHHRQKIDRPSGTALVLERLLKSPIPIKSIRRGDIIGFHQLTIGIPFEKMVLSHEATSRKAFAQGVMWAIPFVFDKKVAHGLIRFEELFRQEFFVGENKR